MWPIRTDLCLDCRTTVAAGDRCRAGPGHRVRSLTAPDGREQVLQEVWGPRPLRQRMRELGRAGATGGSGGGLGSALSNCGGCSVDVGAEALGAIALMIAVCALACIAVAWLCQWTQAWWRRRRARLDPRGATAAPAPVGRPTGRIGAVLGAPVPSPLSSRSCVAFDARLGHGRAVMLRDASTVGFVVALDDGARVRIPAGPLIVQRTRRAPVTLAGREVDAYLRTLDPDRATAADLDPFPCDRIDEAVLCPGDRVEVLGPLRAEIDHTVAAAGYREPAGTILVPDGPPQVRLLARP